MIADPSSAKKTIETMQVAQNEVAATGRTGGGDAFSVAFGDVRSVRHRTRYPSIQTNRER